MVLEWEAFEYTEKGKKTRVRRFVRARVPGGWFVNFFLTPFFYPDPEHVWDGTSLPDPPK